MGATVASKVRTMKYYFINTDFKSLKYSTYDTWIENGLAFTGGLRCYGELLAQLKPEDVCFMYVNGVGVMAVGSVLEEWDGKIYDPPMLYAKPDDEYHIKVDWFLDLRERPIGLDELRRVNGWLPLQTLHPMKNHQGETLFQYILDLGFEPKPRPVENYAISLPDGVTDADILYEEAKHQVSVNAYERNPQARQECIFHYGTSCFVCGFDFVTAYGKVGQGFIHVHHLQQLSDINEQYVVDPINDLRPICPNCHAIIHRRKPPYNIDEVRAFLQQARQ